MEYERDIKKSMILREIAPTSGRDGAISFCSINALMAFLSRLSINISKSVFLVKVAFIIVSIM